MTSGSDAARPFLRKGPGSSSEPTGPPPSTTAAAAADDDDVPCEPAADSGDEDETIDAREGEGRLTPSAPLSSAVSSASSTPRSPTAASASCGGGGLVRRAGGIGRAAKAKGKGRERLSNGASGGGSEKSAANGCAIGTGAAAKGGSRNGSPGGGRSASPKGVADLVEQKLLINHAPKRMRTSEPVAV
mmetsp:Transcript_55698/g.160033  ORF Transcript_55698/g.160033 Transcript_55698/m.160033 type:complete len:188 (-) Transcript_55698:59-622(-)